MVTEITEQMPKHAIEAAPADSLGNTSTDMARRALTGVPAFRPLAVQLLRLMRSEEPSFPEIIALLRTDAVIAAQVVRLANSPLFAARCEIKNVQQALSFLGLERLNSLLMTTALRSLAAIVPAHLSRMCWRHNLAVAIIGRRLSARSGLSPDRCYIAGLIHDIGRLAMMRVFPHYEGSLLEANLSGEDLMQAETRLFGIDHAETGRWLLSQWDCPVELQNVAADHERPWEARGDRELATLVHAASLLADRMELSAFTKANRAELQAISEFLPKRAAERLQSDYPEMADRVAIEISEVELSLF